MWIEQIEFMVSLFEKINDLRGVWYDGRDAKIIMKESENGEPYWTIDIVFKAGNSKYEDCIIFHADDEFNYEEILSELDDIITKARRISE